MSTEASSGQAVAPRPFGSGTFREALTRRWPLAVVWGAVAGWGIGFSVLADERHNAFLSHRFDLGNMVQAVWSTAHGHFLEITTGDGQQLSRLGIHVDPLLAALAPAWLVWPSPTMLTTVQAFALASGALPVFWLARTHTRDGRVAINLSLAYLLYPAVQFGALNDFHAVTLAVPLILFLVWSLDEDRVALAGLFALLAVLSKEDVPLVVAGIGVWYAARRGRRLVGTVIAVLGVTVTLVDLYVVIPHFGGGPSIFYDRLGSVGGSPSGVLRTLATDPGDILAAATTAQDVKYLVVMLLPLAALWAFEPVLVLAAAPVLTLNLLSDFGPMTMVRYQYVSVIVACVFAAAAIGAGRWSGRSSVLLTTATLGLVVLLSPAGPLWSLDTYGASSRPTAAKVAALKRAVELIPTEASLSASNDLGGHLSERRRFYSFPQLHDADWVAVNAYAAAGEVNPVGETTNPRAYTAAVRALAANPRYERVFWERGVLVYRKRGA